MTVSANLNRNDATGNGATTAFTYTFPVYVTTELSVYVAGVLQVINTDYTITGGVLPAATGGTVNFVTAPANGSAVAIIRTAAYTQPYNPADNATFSSQTGLMPQLDELAFQIQQIYEKLNRIPALKNWSTVSLGDATLPDITANQYLAWDSTGTKLTNVAATIATANVSMGATDQGKVFVADSGSTGFITGTEIPFSVTTAGTSTAYTATVSPFPAALAVGIIGWLKIHTASGASPTLAINSIAAKALVYYDQTGTAQAIAASDLATNQKVLIAYSATLDKFVVLAPVVQSAFASFYDTRFAALAGTANIVAGGLGNITGLAITSISTNTTLSIAVGAAMDSTGVQQIKLASAFTKLLDATGTWTAATGGKGNQAASTATATWHVFLIGKTTDLTAADIFFDTSVTAANLAASAAGSAGFNVHRRIGSFNTDGSKNWIAFNSYEISGGGLRVELLVPVRNFSTNNPGTSAVTWTTSGPTGIQFLTECNLNVALAAAANRYILVTSLDQTDTTPTNALYTAGDANSSAVQAYNVSIRRTTSTSATIRYRADASDANLTIAGFSMGWEDARRT